MGIYDRAQRTQRRQFLYPWLLAMVVLIILSQTLFNLSPQNFQPFSPSSFDDDALSSHQAQQISSSSPSHISKALVVASTTQDDTAWLADIPPSLNWTLYHYRVDAPLSPALSVPSTSGNEAMVYLTYIIDHYDDLPDVVFFHHAHLTAWHQALTTLDELALLRPQHVLRAGYASTRCLTSGCENIIPLAGAPPGDWADFRRLDRQTHLVTLLDGFLDRAAGETVPEMLAAPCCAQFAVSGERVRRRSRDWWAGLRRWLVETPLVSMNSGRLMEHLWHVWFGMPAEL